MKPESLVTVNQPRYGEYVLGFCTHRPSSHGSGKRLKFTVRWPKPKLVTGAKLIIRLSLRVIATIIN